MVSTPNLASWGCSPAVAQMRSSVWAMAMAARVVASSQPTLTIVPTPAARAAAMTSATGTPRVS